MFSLYSYRGAVKRQPFRLGNDRKEVFFWRKENPLVPPVECGADQRVPEVVQCQGFSDFFFVCLFLVLQLLILWFIVFFRCCLGYCGDIIRIARVCRLWFEPSSFSISALLYTTCRLSSLRLHQKQDPVFYPSPKRKDFRSYTLFIFKIIIKTNKKKIRWSIVISNRLSAAGYTSVVYPSVFFSSRL
jgi:hypothetical protein